jgi:hypothetical protein
MKFTLLPVVLGAMLIQAGCGKPPPSKSGPETLPATEPAPGPEPDPAPGETPILIGQVTLAGGGETLKSKRTGTPYLPEFVEGERRIAVEPGSLVAYGADGKRLWRSETPGGCKVRRLAAEAHVLFAQKLPRESEVQDRGTNLIQRIDLDSGAWAQPLGAALPPGSVDADAPSILSVIVREGRVFALVQVINGEAGSERRGYSRGYQLSCWEVGSDSQAWIRRGDEKPSWSVSFPPPAQLPRAGLLLIAAAYPASADADIRTLGWADDTLLVCLGEQGPLLGLDPESGKTNWKFERPWETRREFTGPSVWSHSIRGGASADETGWIVGGPAVVTFPPTRDDPTPGGRIFLAFARARSGAYEPQVADCFVCELSSSGNVLAVNPLPRCVSGGLFHADAGGVVWAGQHSSVMRLEPSENRGFGGFGPGGPDCVGRVAWYRECVEPAARKGAVFHAGPAGEPCAFGGGQVFLTVGGGYKKRENLRLYLFPLSVVEAATGNESQLTLEVPMRRDISTKNSNSGGSSHDRDGTLIEFHTTGPCEAGITWLEVVGDDLRVLVAGDVWTGFADFALADVARLASKARR